MHFLQLSSSRPLPQWTVDDGLRLTITNSVTKEAAASLYIAHRSSPIHPLIETNSPPDLNTGTWFVNLIVPQDAFTLLGKIAARAYPGLEENTWFGIGLASVVIFSDDPDLPSALMDEVSQELVAHEQWRIENGRLIDIQLLRLPTPSKDMEHLVFPKLPANPSADLRGIVEEFTCCFRDLHRWATLYGPDETEALRVLLDEVNGLIKELVWLYTKESVVPEDLTDYDLTDSLVCSKLLQQRTDRIVQINSALSFVISQGYFGAPPILSDSCVIRRHSLFGVGRAHRALLNLVREIEKAFAALSVPVSIYEKWAHFPPLPGFESSRDIDTAGWASLDLPDLLLVGPANPHPVKLVYFSGRLGFRESEYGISAAIHALTSGDSPEWHLSTMTHEILHGHVRDLLRAIFDQTGDESFPNIEAYWEHVFKRFRNHMEGRCTNCKLIDSARSVLLSYCCMTPYMGSLTQPPIQPSLESRGLRVGEVVIPANASDLKRRLEEEDRNISEIVVHSLDLYYFYSDNFEAYNRSIWSSWRTVPVVLRDVRQYVLRMLLARTSLDSGEPIERFARARNEVLNSISQLNSDSGPDAVWESAIQMLQVEARPRLDQRTNEARHPLFQPFLAALRVVDLARHCFASGRVKGGLFHDEFIKAYRGDSDFDFEYTAGEFTDSAVRSIAEFTAWRARADESQMLTGNGAERQTAWYFLACGRIPAMAQVTSHSR
jgi:hypothetical protein